VIGLKKVTVDTDVLIDIITSKKITQERRQCSVDFIKEKIEFGSYIGYISAFTCFEIYRGSQSEHANARRLISLFHEIPVRCSIAEKASRFVKKYSLDDGDTIIAATSLATGSSHLITWNKSDYQQIENLSVFSPREGLEALD
jgi:predicted nucleic acid-binding protein